MPTPPVITRTSWIDAPPDGSATAVNDSELQKIYDKVDDLVTRIITVRKNSAGSDFQRARLNFIEGSNITLTVTDDAGGGEVDITIASAGAAAHDIQFSTVNDSLASTGTTDIVSVTEAGRLLVIAGLVTTAPDGTPVSTLEIVVDGGTTRSINVYGASAATKWELDGVQQYGNSESTKVGASIGHKFRIPIAGNYATSLRVSHNITTATTSVGAIELSVWRGKEL